MVTAANICESEEQALTPQWNSVLLVCLFFPEPKNATQHGQKLMGAKLMLLLFFL